MSAVFPTLPTVTMLMAKSAGVTGAELADGGLMPTAFLAITLITYYVPFGRPVTVRDGTIDTGWMKLVHAAPPLLEYFTR